MSLIKLYIDEDSMSRGLVRALRSRSVDVLTASEADMIARSDEEHLSFAGSRGRVLFSFNAGDYHRLHTIFLRTGRSHAGLILARQQQYSIGEQSRRLLKLIATRSAEQMVGHVEFLGSWN